VSCSEGYVAEAYMPRGSADDVIATGLRARAAADEVSAEGLPVRYLRSIFVPEDETCYYLFVGPSAAAVREAIGRAALPVDRIVGVVTDRP
jgi:Protein of unknown function (DUF4242)